MKHENIGLQCMMLAFIFAVCLGSCKDSNDETSAPYDPNAPVEVTDFTPKSGGGRRDPDREYGNPRPTEEP